MIGKKIRACREFRGFSQIQLAELSGINVGTIRKYELGIRNPKPEQLEKIAAALGLNVSIFLDFNIETVGDVLSLLFAIDDSVNLSLSETEDQKIIFQHWLLLILQVDLQLHRAMVGAKDLVVDLSGADAVCNAPGNDKIVDAPARVLFPGVEAVAPPAVLHLVRVNRTEGVGKARCQQLGHLGPLLVSEARAHPVVWATFRSPQRMTGFFASSSSR